MLDHRMYSPPPTLRTPKTRITFRQFIQKSISASRARRFNVSPFANF